MVLGENWSHASIELIYCHLYYLNLVLNIWNHKNLKKLNQDSELPYILFILKPNILLFIQIINVKWQIEWF